MFRTTCRNIILGLGRYCLDQNVGNMLLAIFIGGLSAYGALLFQELLRGSQFLFYQHDGDILGFFGQLRAWQILGLPALGGLLVGLIIHFGASEAKGHGVPEVMTALAMEGGRIRKRVALVKILASAICIGSGGSSGREGPMVQIGSSIGSTLGQFFKVNLMKQRTMVGCGAAAGIAATFNAPIAGVLFALEILIGDFGLTSFTPVVLSSVTATAISRHYWGDLPAFKLPIYKIVSLWEFGLFPLLGLAAAASALLFVVVLYKAEDLFEALRVPEWIKPAIGGLGLGFIVLHWPQGFGVGYGSMNMALLDQMPGLLMLTLIFVKIAATSLTLGSGGSGGIFAPSLFIGAMTGGFFGWAVNALFPGLTASPGAYALIGMGAVVAGTTHAAITAILIIFEMTANYKIILPMMITCIIASTVTTSIKRGSIYTIKLRRRGIDIAGGYEQNILRSLRVRQFMDTAVTTVPESMVLKQIIETFKTADASYLHMLDAHGDLAGIISFRDIRGLLEEEGLHFLVIARDVATRDLAVVRPDETIKKAMRMFSERNISQLPVVGGDTGRKVIGQLREKDVVSAYDKAVVRREIESV